MSGKDLRTAAKTGNLPEAKRILERNPNLINDAVRAAGCPCPARPPAHGAVGPSRDRSAEARPAPLRALPRLGGSGGGSREGRRTRCSLRFGEGGARSRWWLCMVCVAGV